MDANKNMFLAFLQENIQRLFTKSPLFFKIWQIIAGILLLVSWVPDAINLISGYIAIPDLFTAKITLIVKVASVVALFMSSLSTQSKTIGVKESGVVVKTTDTSLPFTVQAEKIAADKAGVATVEVAKTK